MTKEIFIFIASVLLLMPILSVFGEISFSTQFLFCAPFIFMIGIPHGAIDNVLHGRDAPHQKQYFILVYLLIIGFNVILWMSFPLLAYVLFLGISAYHFGQSQFSHYFKRQKLIHQFSYLLWGVSILSALILFNLSEIHSWMNDYPEFALFSPIHQLNSLVLTFGISSILTFGSLFWLLHNRVFTVSSFFMECLIFLLILAAFYLTPLIIGFTLYFIILHSFKVLGEEFRFLRAEKEVSSVLSFLKLLAPFSLLSFLGLGLVFALIYFNLLIIPYGYALLIIISSITLPHVFVMDHFYKLLFRNNFYQQKEKG
ncbi:Brp/Blh family beta-carotene 15,15'-dioxygenase [Salibacteraceae bacterium]|nr:Brp/Blh family beta-carotene 15,15'-dioxygenase [Salibacteraceae bacterium]